MRPQFHQVVPGIGASQRVPVDLARGAPVRADLRLQVLSGREIDLGEPFQHLLPVPVVDGTVVEDHDHERQAENGLGAQKGHVRHSGHLNFDRNRDLLFHFFGGTARPLGNDRHIVVGDIGIGLHRQVVKRDGPPAEQQDGNGQHHKLVVKRKVYKSANHLLFPCFVGVL